MSRPLPLCALCGKSLTRQARMLLTFGGLAGRPEVGWHGECAHEDQAWQVHQEQLGRGDATEVSAGSLNLLQEIDRRATGGQHRIVSWLPLQQEKGGTVWGWGAGLRSELKTQAPSGAPSPPSQSRRKK